MVRDIKPSTTKKDGRISIAVEDIYPISLKLYRGSRGSYRWEIEVKAGSLQEVEEKIRLLDEWCRERFEPMIHRAESMAPSKTSNIVDTLPESVIPIKYRDHVLGKIVFGHNMTSLKIDNSVKIKLKDPAISRFLVQKVIYPLCDKLQARFNPVESDGCLREIIIDKPLSGEDADEFIRSCRWAIRKAFSKPLARKTERKEDG